MLRPIYRLVLNVLMICGLFFGWNELFASIPPHPRVAKLINEKQIPIPYYLQKSQRIIDARCECTMVIA